MSEERTPQFLIIGAGSLGCVYGANLSRIGQNVAFLDVHAEQVAAINGRGLHCEGLTGDFVVHCFATTDPAKAPPSDVVLLCAPSHATAQTARSAEIVLKPDGYCLTLQNGAGNVEQLTAVLAESRVVAGLSFQSGDLVAPGDVRHTNDGPTYLGELDGSRTSRLDQITKLFADCGLDPVVVPNIVNTIWEKFVHNCGINAISALTGLRPGEFKEVPAIDDFQTRIIEETLSMLRMKGIVLPERDFVQQIKSYCAHKFHRPSMLQHLLRGQRTEIDSLNGLVVQEVDRLGGSAPFSRALTQLILGREFQSGRERSGTPPPSA